MKKRVPAIVLLWLIIDVYFFAAVQTLTANTTIYLAYWLFDGLLGATIVFSAFTGKTKVISWLMALMLLSFVPKLIGSIVLLLEDVTRLVRGFPPHSVGVSQFVLIIAGVFFLLLLFGVTRGRHYYKVRRETLYFPDLPEEFDGFTITQLSDIHSGSFSDAEGVQKGLDLVNAQKSDMILFTGDLVNNHAAEMDPWIPAFAKLEAPYGKYSVLGNHDYGDYMRWDNVNDKHANLQRLKNVHKEIGFRLLLNESLTIDKNGESLALIGVENWGKGGFHKYGDLEKAAARVPNDAFKVLMSHDPSHWDAVTMGHHQHVHLTLSGHTHGAQFGFELFGFKWSPIKYVYKQWAGLYEQSGKYLYVNRGFGFLGLKGRIGIWPEIAVLTLRRK
ncbi:metallophosphoesterase [Mucilaginibacter ginsenosidivorax]|uniref:Metallophosphoesterase n=1 Tax=Mucilaginibacter ginsenosidivorax TaxID=862126 RepID=A0A5B8W267_9SPHI|nr:metallophosphoesterase [Mucilaginibacter ginsenosidivorax]QEC77055.1 metallophosphoesterase [Mucilaginibacter ginsenosidivorax]